MNSKSWVQCPKLSPKHSIFYYLFIRNHIMIQGLQCPNAVGHMVSVVFLEAERSIIQSEGNQIWACGKTL